MQRYKFLSEYLRFTKLDINFLEKYTYALVIFNNVLTDLLSNLLQGYHVCIRGECIAGILYSAFSLYIYRVLLIK